MPILLALLCWSATHAQNLDPIVPEGAVVRQLATGFRFTEGPAIDSAGNLYFTIYSAAKSVSAPPTAP